MEGGAKIVYQYTTVYHLQSCGGIPDVLNTGSYTASPDISLAYLQFVPRLAIYSWQSTDSEGLKTSLQGLSSLCLNTLIYTSKKMCRKIEQSDTAERRS